MAGRAFTDYQIFTVGQGTMYRSSTVQSVSRYPGTCIFVLKIELYLFQAEFFLDILNFVP
jgi:hypothetical protein